MNDVTNQHLCNPEIGEAPFSDTENLNSNFSTDKFSFVAEENSEATIRRVLSAYEIGAKLRRLRLKKKIALVDLGKHTGLSASMLSQLENGKLMPTLPTLARIAMVFDVGLDHFFGSQKGKRLFALTRAEERMRFPDGPGKVKPNYFFECLAYAVQDKGIQCYLAEFPRRAADEVAEHLHEGAEFLIVLEGSLCVRYDSEDHILQKGDSLYFDPAEPHSYRGTSKIPARAVVITTAPRL